MIKAHEAHEAHKCPPNRQMACLSSSYTARERNVLLLTSTPGD
jgi:hypothetical protein|eukprot:COSAG01_NODE_3123_length_6553_cov_9.997676_8_plen_43_part_00